MAAHKWGPVRSRDARVLLRRKMSLRAGAQHIHLNAPGAVGVHDSAARRHICTGSICCDVLLSSRTCAVPHKSSRGASQDLAHMQPEQTT